MTDHMRRRLAAARLGAALAALGVLSAIGIDLAKGSRADEPAASAASKVTSKTVKDGSLRFRDFRKGELERRFTTVGTYRAGRAELAGKLDTLTGKITTVAAGAAELAGSYGVLAGKIEQVQAATADLVGKWEGGSRDIDDLQARVGDLQDVLSGVAVTDSVKSSPLLAVAGLAAVSVSLEKAGSIHLENLTGSELRYVAEVNGTTMDGLVEAGGAAVVPTGAAPSQTDIQVIGPDRVATFAVAAAPATAGQQFFGQAVALAR